MGAVEDWVNKVNTTYKADVASVASNYSALKIPRLTTGILSLDLALGGGIPFGRHTLIVGNYSTAKTAIATKLAASVENYDHLTKKHKIHCTEGFQRGRALFMDMEGTFDLDWAKCLGFDPEWHIVARPDCSEQAIDMITSALEENTFDLIIIDSNAQLCPQKEVTNSAEDSVVGLHARMLNAAYRKWTSRFNKVSQKKLVPAAVFAINNFRVNIGQMFGDPRTYPGGKQQSLNSSIIIYTKSSKIEDSKESEQAYGTYGGMIEKNKTFIPKHVFTFDLALKDTSTGKKGSIDNSGALFDYGKKYGLIKIGKEVTFGKYEFKTQAEMKNQIAASQVIRDSLWMSIIKAACGVIV